MMPRRAGVEGSEENEEDAATGYVSRGMMGVAPSPTVNTTTSVRSVQGSTRRSIAQAETDLPVIKGSEEGLDGATPTCGE